MNIKHASPIIVITLTSILAGCGGSSGSSTPGTPTINNPTVKVTWGARSRDAAAGPSSALSATFVLRAGDSNGNDITFTVNRDSTQLASYTGTYPVPKPIKSQNTTVNAVFHALADGQGSVVATSDSNVTPNGNNLEFTAFSLNSRIASVATKNVTEFVGDSPRQLTFTAYDQAGSIVPVTPGSAQWTTTSGATVQTLTADGISTPLTTGTSNIAVSVDGVASPTALVTVTTAPLTSPTIQVQWPARSRTALPGSLTSAESLKITINNADPNGNDIGFRINRDLTQVGAYTGTYTIPATVSSQANSLSAAFYARPDEQGAQVGIAFAQINFAANNINIGNFALTGYITKVTVPNATVSYATGPHQLTFDATDSTGTTIAVTPGSAIFTVVNAGPFTVTNDGIVVATGVNGSGNVRATVDTIDSAPATITVVR